MFLLHNCNTAIDQSEHPESTVCEILSKYATYSKRKGRSMEYGWHEGSFRMPMKRGRAMPMPRICC